MDLIDYMKCERSRKIKGIYRLFQISMAFNSNKIEGSQLNEEQTKYLFDDDKMNSENGESISLDDIYGAVNHFCAFDYVMDHVDKEIDLNMLRFCTAY